MAYNKVRALISYKTGKYHAQMIAYHTVEVGKEYKCQVLNGYTTDCIVKEILKYNVDKETFSKHGRVLPNAPAEKEEEVIMTSELFEMAVVSSIRGNISLCKLIEPTLVEGQEVVYEGSDGRLFVGTILEIGTNGVRYKDAKVTGGFIVHAVDRTLLDAAREKEMIYVTTIRQLNERKKLMEERAIWAMLAEKDDEAKKLLKTLDDIRGGSNGKGNS